MTPWSLDKAEPRRVKYESLRLKLLDNTVPVAYHMRG